MQARVSCDNRCFGRRLAYKISDKEGDDMKTRTLGRTGLHVGEIGLGLEYLEGKPESVVVDTIRTAYDGGVTYFDVIFSFKDYLKNLSKAFEGIRENIVLAAHIGSGEKKGKYRRTRKLDECRMYFDRVLETLDTPYIDVGFLHFVSPNEYEQVFEPGKIMDIALEYRQRGIIRHIAMSTHDPFFSMKIINEYDIDVLMIQVNVLGHTRPGMNELLKLCIEKDVGLVAMKPYAGGRLLRANKTVYLKESSVGRKGGKKKMPKEITPLQCLHYVLSQPAVSTVVPGPSSAEEIREVLGYSEMEKDSLDFAPLLEFFNEYQNGACVYCNHCLPCPADINIGEMLRFFDSYGDSADGEARNTYKTLEQPASACIECGNCEERCPFSVPVISLMRRIRDEFEVA